MEELFDKHSGEFIQWLNRQWSFFYEKQRPEINIDGSPERSVCRTVIQDQAGELFLLEKFSRSRFQVRHTVACVVNYLNQQGLDAAVGYQKTSEDDFLPFWKDHFYGLSPFVSGSVLIRPDYLDSARMGKSFSFFLQKMKTASSGIESNIVLSRFSIKSYIYQLLSQMYKFDPKTFAIFSPFASFLEKRFMGAHDRLAVGFCHGDIHPLNVIWDKERIKAVIDWEFAGIKPQIYDAANLVGCAGIENPEGLGMNMVQTFLNHLKAAEIFDASAWNLFPEYVLALRFAWLSEWLRKKDSQMIEMEAALMRIIMKNMEALRQIWKIDR